MSKNDFTIKPVEKHQAEEILNNFHYLSKISKGFRGGVIIGLFKKSDGGLFGSYDKMVGVATFSQFPTPELLVGMYGFSRDDSQEGFYELSRFCIEPETQKTEHNISSWFLSRAIKKLKKMVYVRSILSYADDDFHKGTIYKATNFKYYGLTEPKNDFWKKLPNGEFEKVSRGKVKGVEGEWRPRSRKHRFVLEFDKKLNIKWEI